MWHKIFVGGYFCRLAIFCVLRELIFAIRTDWFFLQRINFCDFQKVFSTQHWSYCFSNNNNLFIYTVLLTGCGKKIKIVRDFGGKLCGEKHRLCGNCAGLRNLSTYQIFRDCEQELPEKYTATYCIDCSFQWYKLTRPFSALIYLRYIINITWIKT